MIFKTNSIRQLSLKALTAILLSFQILPAPAQSYQDSQSCNIAIEGRLLRSNPLVIAPVYVESEPIQENPFPGAEEKFKSIPEGSLFRAHVGEQFMAMCDDTNLRLPCSNPPRKVCSVEAIDHPDASLVEKDLLRSESSYNPLWWDASGIWIYFNGLTPIKQIEENLGHKFNGSLTVFNDGRVIYDEPGIVFIDSYKLSDQQRTILKEKIYTLLIDTTQLESLSSQQAIIVMDHGFHKYPMTNNSEPLKVQLNAIASDMLIKSNAHIRWSDRQPVSYLEWPYSVSPSAMLTEVQVGNKIKLKGLMSDPEHINFCTEVECGKCANETHRNETYIHYKDEYYRIRRNINISGCGEISAMPIIYIEPVSEQEQPIGTSENTILWSPKFQTSPEKLTQGMIIPAADAEKFISTIGKLFLDHSVLAGNYLYNGMNVVFTDHKNSLFQ